VCVWRKIKKLTINKKICWQLGGAHSEYAADERSEQSASGRLQKEHGAELQFVQHLLGAEQFYGDAHDIGQL
jgi:hypothetical protein